MCAQSTVQIDLMIYATANTDTHALTHIHTNIHTHAYTNVHFIHTYLSEGLVVVLMRVVHIPCSCSGGSVDLVFPGSLLVLVVRIFIVVLFLVVGGTTMLLLGVLLRVLRGAGVLYDQWQMCGVYIVSCGGGGGALLLTLLTS